MLQTKLLHLKKDSFSLSVELKNSTKQKLGCNLSTFSVNFISFCLFRTVVKNIPIKCQNLSFTSKSFSCPISILNTTSTLYNTCSRQERSKFCSCEVPIIFDFSYKPNVVGLRRSQRSITLLPSLNFLTVLVGPQYELPNIRVSPAQFRWVIGQGQSLIQIRCFRRFVCFYVFWKKEKRN